MLGEWSESRGFLEKPVDVRAFPTDKQIAVSIREVQAQEGKTARVEQRRGGVELIPLTVGTGHWCTANGEVTGVYALETLPETLDNTRHDFPHFA
ncbi:MAG: hypothetical protein Q7V53_03390 [Caldisericota bacterium]|nr:hypothetical protein [Caldisericota bacterium]